MSGTAQTVVVAPGGSEDYQSAGEFKAGSMGPKIEAALRFARAGRRSVIDSLLDVAPAMRGAAGTTIAAPQ